MKIKYFFLTCIVSFSSIPLSGMEYALLTVHNNTQETIKVQGDHGWWLGYNQYFTVKSGSTFTIAEVTPQKFTVSMCGYDSHHVEKKELNLKAGQEQEICIEPVAGKPEIFVVQ